jgi:translation initiation factor IF-2
MDDIKGRVIALLPVIVETRVTGEATVLQLFDIHLKAKQIKKVAGCRVVNGTVDKSKFARAIRNGVKIHEGTSFKTSIMAPTYQPLPRNLGHDAAFEERCR